MLLLCRYAENQDLVNKNAALVQQQTETIAELRNKVEQPGAGAGASSKALQAANKRAKELEAELEEVKVKGSLAVRLQCRYPLWRGCISFVQTVCCEQPDLDVVKVRGSLGTSVADQTPW